MPQIVFLTGPRGTGKTRWAQRFLLAWHERHPTGRIDFIQGEQGRARMENFVASASWLSLRKVEFPCFCCTGLIDLPGIARAMTEHSRADWLLIEAPALAATSLLEELDRTLGWPHRTVTCLSATMANRAPEQALPPFFEMLLANSDLVVTDEPTGATAITTLLDTPAPNSAR